MDPCCRSLTAIGGRTTTFDSLAASQCQQRGGRYLRGPFARTHTPVKGRNQINFSI